MKKESTTSTSKGTSKPTTVKKPKRREIKPPNLRTLIYTRKWEECVEAVKSFPDQAKLTDKLGDLPIHEACNSGAPFSVVKALHRGYPNGIQEKGFCGRLPLHYAAYNRPSLHIIQYLLRQYPDSATTFDADGRLPLHLAVVRNAPKQAIQTLIAAYPKSLTIPNQFGNTPEMLARNEHVYDLLLAEKKKPRGINQKLDLEKKLMRDWMDGSKSPVSDESTKNLMSTKKKNGNVNGNAATGTSTNTNTGIMSSTQVQRAKEQQFKQAQLKQQQQQQQKKENTIPTTIGPKSNNVITRNTRTHTHNYSDPYGHIATSKSRTTPAKKQEHGRYSHTTTSTTTHTPRYVSPMNRPHRRTPKTTNKTYGTSSSPSSYSTKATQEAGKILTLSRRSSTGGISSTGSISSARSRRSQSTTRSTRSRRTILATYDDMEHLEFTTDSMPYKESRQSSPRSPLEYGNFPTHRRRSRSLANGHGGHGYKRPVMSNNGQNRRKVLPSPTRVRMVVHPIWK